MSNVVGNSGMLAAKEVYDADADGYTILFTHSSINVNTAAGTSDIGIEDFEMVRVCGRPAVEAIAVRSDSPYETLDDLVAAIKENPGDFIVPASIGATSHYACLLMEKACGVELNIVNSGASSDRTAGLKGGNFEFIINPYGTMKSFIDSGDFRILATVGEERSSQFPDIPTAKELGYEDLVSVNAYYILVPKGTPEAIIEKLVSGGFVERKGKNLIPTKAGVNLVTVLPELLTSPKLTADWEQRLNKVAKGQASSEDFMDGIEAMAAELVRKYSHISEDGQKLFQPEKETVGLCPRCGKPVYEGKKNFACSDRACQFVMWKNDRFFEERGKTFTPKIAAALLKDGKAKVKGLRSLRTGKTYDGTIVLADTGGKYVNYRIEK